MATDVVAKASLYIGGKALCISVTCSLSEDIKGAGLGATQNRHKPALFKRWVNIAAWWFTAGKKVPSF